MMTRFDGRSYPHFEIVEEDGYPQPCVMGRAWVNLDTLKTIRKRGGVPTDPRGRPLATGTTGDVLPHAVRTRTRDLE